MMLNRPGMWMRPNVIRDVAIVNPGFEEWDGAFPAGWHTENRNGKNEFIVHDGNYSFSFSRGTSLSQSCAVTAKSEYRLSWYTYSLSYNQEVIVRIINAMNGVTVAEKTLSVTKDVFGEGTLVFTTESNIVTIEFLSEDSSFMLDSVSCTLVE